MKKLKRKIKKIRRKTKVLRDGGLIAIISAYTMAISIIVLSACMIIYL